MAPATKRAKTGGKGGAKPPAKRAGRKKGGATAGDKESEVPATGESELHFFQALHSGAQEGPAMHRTAKLCVGQMALMLVA